MTNDVHGSSLTEEQINEISDAFNGTFRGRMILTIETTEIDGQHRTYRFVLRPGNARSLPFDASQLHGKAQCLDGTASVDGTKQTTTVVGWDPRTTRFVFATGERVDAVTPPATSLIDIHRFSSIKSAA